MADIVIINAQTGEVVERDFTPEERAQRDADEAAAALAAATAAITEGNRATLTDRAATALQANRDFLALTTPSNAQVLAQVKALTQQNTALIRLLLNLLDGTD